MLPKAVIAALDHDDLLVSLLGASVHDGEPAVFSDDAEGFDPGPPPVPLLPVLLAQLVPPLGYFDGLWILETESEILLFRAISLNIR